MNDKESYLLLTKTVLGFEWTLIRGGHLFEAGCLLTFLHFQKVVCLFCNKTINDCEYMKVMYVNCE